MEIQKLSGTCRYLKFLSALVDPILQNVKDIDSAILFTCSNGLIEELSFLIQKKIIGRSFFIKMIYTAAEYKQRNACLYLNNTVRSVFSIKDDLTEYDKVELLYGGGLSGDIAFVQWLFDTFFMPDEDIDQVYYWWYVFQGACNKKHLDLVQYALLNHDLRSVYDSDVYSILVNATNYGDDIEKIHGFYDLSIEYLVHGKSDTEAEEDVTELMLEHDYIEMFKILYERYKNRLGYVFFAGAFAQWTREGELDKLKWITQDEIMHYLLTNKGCNVDYMRLFIDEYGKYIEKDPKVDYQVNQYLELVKETLERM